MGDLNWTAEERADHYQAHEQILSVLRKFGCALELLDDGCCDECGHFTLDCFEGPCPLTLEPRER